MFQPSVGERKVMRPWEVLLHNCEAKGGQCCRTSPPLPLLSVRQEVGEHCQPGWPAHWAVES